MWGRMDRTARRNRRLHSDGRRRQYAQVQQTEGRRGCSWTQWHRQPLHITDTYRPRQPKQQMTLFPSSRGTVTKTDRTLGREAPQHVENNTHTHSVCSQNNGVNVGINTERGWAVPQYLETICHSYDFFSSISLLYFLLQLLLIFKWLISQHIN